MMSNIANIYNPVPYVIDTLLQLSILQGQTQFVMGVYDRDIADNSVDDVDALCLDMGDLMLGDEFTLPKKYRSWLQFFTASLSFRLVLKDYENSKHFILCMSLRASIILYYYLWINHSGWLSIYT